MQAAILRVRLTEIDAAIERRRQIAGHYDAALSATAARLQPSASSHVYGYYTILVEDRDGFRKGMADKGVATAVYYPKPLHRHKHFGRTCRFDSLPIVPEMTDAEVDYVALTAAAVLS